MEPVRWGPGKREAFLDWIDKDLLAARGYRAGLESRWRRWLEMYRAPADQPIKRHPFLGASNMVLPVIATDVDQMFARLLQTIHAADNVWALAPLNETWADSAKPMQDFLTLLDHRLLKMYQVNKRVVMECVKLGTGIYKTHWHFESRPVADFTGGGAKRVQKTVGRPVVDHVALADFLLPSHATDLNPEAQGGAEWVAERLRLSVPQFQILATKSAPHLPLGDPAAVKQILDYIEQSLTDSQAKVRDLDYVKTASVPRQDFDRGNDVARGPSGGPEVRQVELWEIHARVETAPNQINDIVVWYHQPTRTLLREVLEDMAVGGRPYDVIRYFPGEGFYGIGMCEQLEMFQKSISDTFNFQMDNMLLGNSIGIAAKAGSNIAPGEPIYPGMVKITDGNPSEEFTSFRLGDINPGIGQTLDQLMVLAQRRDGLGDLQQGQIDSLPGRTPATTVLSLLQEGSRRPDLTIKDIRYEGLANVGLKVLQLLQFHAAKGSETGGDQYLVVAAQALGMPEGAAVAEKIALPLEDVTLGLAVSLAATSGTQNKEVEREKYNTLVQLALGVGNAVVQLQTTSAQAALQLPGMGIDQTALAVAKGVTKLFTRLLQQYDIPDVESIVPAQTAPAPGTALLLAQQQRALAPAAGADGGGGQGDPAASGQPGVGGVGGGGGGPAGAAGAPPPG